MTKPKNKAAQELGRLGGKAKRNRTREDYVRAAKLRWARAREARAKSEKH